jgi:hypothetical protein
MSINRLETDLRTRSRRSRASAAQAWRFSLEIELNSPSIHFPGKRSAARQIPAESANRTEASYSSILRDFAMVWPK